MNWLGQLVQTEIARGDSVLDLGCGIMQATKGLQCKFILGCDVWIPYLNELKADYPTIKINLSELYRFPDSSYDVVICLDVIEHLSEELALTVINEMKRICRKKAIVYTPRFFQTNEEAVKDSWGLGENPHQKHLCLITRGHLHSSGYTVSNDNEDGGTFGVYTK